MASNVNTVSCFSGQYSARRLGFYSHESAQFYFLGSAKSVGKGCSVRALKACMNSGFDYMFEIKDEDVRSLAALVDRSKFSRYPCNGWECGKTQPFHLEKLMKEREKVRASMGFFLETMNAFPFFPDDLPKGKYIEAPCYSLNVNKNLLQSYYGSIVPKILSKVDVKEWNDSTSSVDMNVLQSLSCSIHSGKDLAKKIMLLEPDAVLVSIRESDKSRLLSLLSIGDQELKAKLKCNEKLFMKMLRNVKVQRLPKHFVLSDFFMKNILPMKKAIAIKELLGN